jgi:hypothetical protein
LNRNKDVDKLSVGLAKFVVEYWFVIKLEGACCLLQRKVEKKKEMEGGHSSSHKLSIKDGFKSVSNYVC